MHTRLDIAIRQWVRRGTLNPVWVQKRTSENGYVTVPPGAPPQPALNVDSTEPSSVTHPTNRCHGREENTPCSGHRRTGRSPWCSDHWPGVRLCCRAPLARWVAVCLVYEGSRGLGARMAWPSRATSGRDPWEYAPRNAGNHRPGSRCEAVAAAVNAKPSAHILRAFTVFTASLRSLPLTTRFRLRRFLRNEPESPRRRPGDGQRLDAVDERRQQPCGLLGGDDIGYLAL